ncbi:GNAT family N-acetyltransferase [Aeromicrobium sp. A1-2]|uniref:GNAT family N-acetyltransferase n=1 Tax=Aeromicrobium sp. A1-2 TaxID=2107713 RepID=UPI000E48F53D|nr:GNAT family N-acetyltransferase [Aeromicrobium sp. A1-2]AXT85647.1 GNAT family N-acetyltransferase [Aeromicrobium sp. A1-2]
MSATPLGLPVDQTSHARLAADGLTLARLDPADGAAYEAWIRAENRGFLQPDPTPEVIEHRRGYLGDDRIMGVWDSSLPHPQVPVATTISWIADLTLPGGGAAPTWAISGVTVAPTHRRRGIARALLEAELRTAVELGLPLAMLTVSESTIYGRFGFSPSVLARNLSIDRRRAHWTGPVAPGRVHLVSAEQLRSDGHPIVERVRAATPGQVHYAATSILWDRQLGLPVGDDNAKNLRFARYDDADGTPAGFAIYRFVEDPADFTQHELRLQTLVAATPDAYAGLWRFLLEMDLVATITADLRPVDEPLRWMIADFRAVRSSETDHLWTRILDVKASLEARTYAAPGRIVLRVEDPLDFAAGTWALEVDDAGSATVTATADTPDVDLTVNALSSLHVGGVSARVLEAAGALTGDVARLDAMFRSPVAPYTSIWF